MSLRERTRHGLGIIEPCLPSPAKASLFIIGAFVAVVWDAKVRPVIVWIHGGALITGNRDLENREDFTRFPLAFAKAEGCAVVSIDYRLAPERYRGSVSLAC